MKGRINFEITYEDKIYRFDVPNSAPLGECYDACHQFMEYITKKIQESVANSKPKEIKEKKEKKNNAKK